VPVSLAAMLLASLEAVLRLLRALGGDRRDFALIGVVPVSPGERLD